MKQEMQVSSPFHLDAVVNDQVSQKDHCYVASKTKYIICEKNVNRNFTKSCKELNTLLTSILSEVYKHPQSCILQEKTNAHNEDRRTLVLQINRLRNLKLFNM